MSIPKGMIKRILEEETSPIRFEQFCCELFTERDQQEYLATSQSWDLSRDGRTLPSATGKVGFICATTEKTFDAKAKSDLERLLKFAKPASIYFCTSQSESEHSLQKTENEIKELARDVQSITAVGGHQFASLVQAHRKAFEHRYVAELLDNHDFLSETNAQENILGMQAALATNLDETAQTLRDELLKFLTIATIASKTKCTISALAKSVSDSLHLPRIIESLYFKETIDKLSKVGLIKASNGILELTKKGEDYFQASKKHTREKNKKIKEAVRHSIEKLLNDDLSDGGFDKLWQHLQDELSNLFLAQGLKVIQAISSLTNNQNPGPRSTFGELLEGMRKRIIALQIGGGRSDAVAQAVIDLFSEKESEAFQWLSELAVKYVNLCSLGLEPSAQHEISGRLRDLDLVLDTDVILSLISEGERPHQAILDALERWKKVGGGVVITPPVIEEAAYHAWISEFEYIDLAAQLSGFTEEEMRRYVKNAFVRAFYYLGDGNYSMTRWKRYISEYRGRSREDATKIESILTEKDYKLVPEMPKDAAFEKKVRDRIFELRHLSLTAYVPKSVGDKIVRDTKLLSFVKLQKSQLRNRYHRVIIISSSPILQKVAKEFENELGDHGAVWPVGAIAFLMTLIPGVKLTMNTLRNCLFDEHDFDSLDQITQFALRVIRQSEEYTLGYSQRPTLKSALQRKIDRAAKERGQRPNELVSELLDPEKIVQSKDKLTEVIADAIDEIQASESEKKKK